MKTKNLIIGFGKAWKTLAIDLANAWEEVVLIEKSPEMYGWTCINIGCIPSKILITQGEKWKNFTQAMEFKNTLVWALRGKNFEKLNTSDKITIIDWEASFLSKNSVRVIWTNDDEKIIEADRIFINTGSKPKIPNIEWINLEGVYTSTTLMNISKIPDHLVILGWWFIGVEFAGMFANFWSKVTIINSSENPFPNEDVDFREKLINILGKHNINFINNSRATKIQKNDGKLEIFYNNWSIIADSVLVAVGREPNTKNLSLENAGILTDDKWNIIVDDKLQTSVPNIYAMGDVNGWPQFTYISLDDYRIVRNNIFGGDYNSRNMRKSIATSVFMPVVYSHIGLKEHEIDASNSDIAVKILPTSMIPKSKILEENDGLLKAIVNKKTGEILGCTLLCEESHEIINIVKLAMDNNLSYNVLKNQIFTHPTMAESLNDLFNF